MSWRLIQVYPGLHPSSELDLAPVSPATVKSSNISMMSGKKQEMVDESKDLSKMENDEVIKLWKNLSISRQLMV